MAHRLHGLVATPVAPAQGGTGDPIPERTSRRPHARAALVSDEQLLAFVEAAQALGRRQRDHATGTSSAAADERLLRLDWAVRAGRLELAARAAAAGGPVPPARAVLRTAPWHAR